MQMLNIHALVIDLRKVIFFLSDPALVLVGEAPQRLLRDSVRPPSEKAKEAAKALASAATAPQKSQQYV